MPVMECTLDGEQGWKWGNDGACYIGPDAKVKAEEQGTAAHAGGYTGDSRMAEVARQGAETLRADAGAAAAYRAGMTRAVRYDAAQLLPPRVRQDGSLLVDGVVTAPGVYPYWDGAEGRVVWELKPPEDFATDSFAMKLNALTITDDHPDPGQYPRGVKTDSFGALAVGVTMPDAQVLSDGRTRVSGVVMRQDGIASVQGGRTAWSLGAMVDIEHTSGTHEGQRYDRIQRNPEPNHLAFVDVPRVAGAGVRVDNLDDAAAQAARVHRLDGQAVCMIALLRADGETIPTTETEDSVKVIRIDGVDVPEGIAGQVQTLLDRRDQATTEQHARADSAESERDTLRGELEVANKRYDDRGEDLVASIRLALTAYEDAKPVADHLDIPLRDDAGQVRSLDAVRRDCLAKHLANNDWQDTSKRNDDSVMGAFEALRHRVEQRDGNLHTEHTRTDGPATSYESARRNYHLALQGQQ